MGKKNKKRNKKILLLRDPFVVRAIHRPSAGPMKSSKRWLHKKIRREGKKIIEEEFEDNS